MKKNNAQNRSEDEDEPICADVNYAVRNCSGFDQMVVIDGPPGSAWDPTRCLFDDEDKVNRTPKYKCVSMFMTTGVQVNAYAEGRSVISASPTLPAYCQCAH